jgi:hypothetical protein
MNNAQVFSVNSKLDIEIMNGSGAGTGHDQLQRSGNLVLDGILNVTETGTVPDGTYTIVLLTSGTISGTFNTVNLPSNYSIVYNASSVNVGQVVLHTSIFYKHISARHHHLSNGFSHLYSLVQWFTYDNVFMGIF